MRYVQQMILRYFNPSCMTAVSSVNRDSSPSGSDHSSGEKQNARQKSEFHTHRNNFLYRFRRSLSPILRSENYDTHTDTRRDLLQGKLYLIDQRSSGERQL